MNEIKQNAQFTFKHNQFSGRHGWLRLTPAYSVKVVEKVFSELDYCPQCVLEPFSGTGTTELVCANKGICSVAYDVNPFLVWLAKVKTNIYGDEIINSLNYVAESIVKNLSNEFPAPYPPIRNITRWWNAKQLDYLARLKNVIWRKQNSYVFDLLKVAFCRQVFELSNIAVNHISTSFTQENNFRNDFDDDIGNSFFLKSCKIIQDTLVEQPKVSVLVKEQNSLNIPFEMSGNYDTVITSPPYPNRISYIRELRPYMYWLDYIKTTTDASELDWETIGGTWGSATSKLLHWNLKNTLLPRRLTDIAKDIVEVDNKSSKLMANYVLKYFEDMSTHFQSVFRTIKSGGNIYYIVGNSSFYGYVVPSELIYEEILTRIGFQDVKSTVIRKRNCNKSLYEYCISAVKP